jgi:Bacterial SH3 domain
MPWSEATKPRDEASTAFAKKVHRPRIEGTTMKRRLGILALSLLSLNYSFEGCASTSEEQAGGTIGARVGAALDAITGALADKKKPGPEAAPGAIVGGAAEWAVSELKTKSVKSRDQAVADLRYTAEQGVLTTIEETSTTPQQQRPGADVTVQARYSVLAPPKMTEVNVRETHSVFFANEVVSDVQREISLTQGTLEVEFQITLPARAAEGRYTVLTTMQALVPGGGKREQTTSSFTVSAAVPPAAGGGPTTPAAAVPVAVPPPASGQQPRLIPDALYVKNPAANIRGGAGLSFPVVTTAPRGARLEVLEEGGTATDRWYRVRLSDGREGWIAASVVGRTP